MRRILPLVLIAGPALAQPPAAPNRAEVMAERALQQKLASLPLDERLAVYEKLLQTQPQSTRIRNELALLYLQKMRETTDPRYLQQASKQVDAVLTQAPADLGARRIRNEIRLQRHEFRTVAQDARELVTLGPSDAGSWGTLGDALMELGQYEEAASAYQTMVSSRPNVASYSRVAYHKFVTGDVNSALGHMQLAWQVSGGQGENAAWCAMELADMLFKVGKLADAEAAYKESLRLFPSAHRAHAAYGRMLAALGRVDEAVREYQRAQAIVPMVEYAGVLDELFAAQGKPEQARKQQALMDATAQLNAANGEKADRTLAILYAEQGRQPERARALVEAELENRADVYTYDALAWVAYRQKRYTDADGYAKKALAWKTPEPLFYFHAGKVALALDRKEEARGLFRRALELNPKFHRVYAAEAARQTSPSD